MTDAPLVRTADDGRVARIALNRPRRHNSLVPDLLDALNAAIDAAAASQARVLVLSGEGPSFSTGGDVAGFAAVPQGQRRDYAARVVGALNRAILGLIDLPMPTIARVHGPVTGGSLGLVLACDLVAIAAPAFVAPYYVEVGFAPDGGWTALLPDRIGAARAREIQMLNRHVDAAEAVALGIAHQQFAADRLDAGVDAWIEALCAKVACGVAATRALLRTPPMRQTIADGLQRELDRFVGQIDSEAVAQGMTAFLGRKQHEKGHRLRPQAGGAVAERDRL